MTIKDLLDDAVDEVTAQLRIDLDQASAQAATSRSRRRHRATAVLAGLAASAVVIGALLSAGGGLSVRDITAAPVPPVRAGAAEVNAQTGVITLPRDRFGLSPSEDAIHRTANSLAMARCMKAAGFGSFYPFLGPASATPMADRTYGVWVEAQVARYGYAVPPPGAQERRALTENRRHLSAAADRAFQACIPQVGAPGLRLPTPPEDSVAPGGQPVTADQTAPGAAIVADWVACLRAHGVQAPAGHEWIPRGAATAPKAEQIRIGLIDVGCKARLHTIQRLADLQAALDQPAIDRDHAQLAAQRQALNALVERSEAYLKDAPELANS